MKGKSKPGHGHCIICTLVVSISQKAMLCDMCDHYCHIDCDDVMPEELYDIMVQHSDNPLKYLCPICIRTTTFHKVELDNKVDEITKQIHLINNDIKAQTTSQTLQIKQIEDKLNELDIQSKYSALSNKLEEMETKMSDIYQQNLVIEKEQRDMKVQADDASHIRSKISALSEFSNEAEEEEDEQAGFIKVRRKSHKRYSAPLDSNDNRYDRTLVLYNTSKQMNDMQYVQDIAHYHYIDPQEIVGVRRIEHGKFPLEVEVRSVTTKWKLIKEVNRFKINGVYSRPYMNADQLKEDRKLTKDLRQLREDNKGKVYKIMKGEIVEKTDMGFVKTNDQPSKN